MTNPTIQRIEKEIKSHKVVLFVKGSPQAPMCGFSATVMELFKNLQVPFHAVDILANQDIREQLPEYSGWGTFPRVFIDGNLVGGCDVTTELYESGELQKLLKL